MVRLSPQYKNVAQVHLRYFMTIKEYADTRQVSYEAVRQLVKKLDTELSGHITKDKRTRVLDNEAVRILDDRRKGSRVSVI